jgi:hypothetical protein
MPPVGFEPMISAGEQSQTYVLDRAATGTGMFIYVPSKLYLVKLSPTRCKHVQYTALLPLTSKTTTPELHYLFQRSSSVGTW